MSFTVRKAMTAFPPRLTPDVGAPVFLTGGLAKVGSVLTMNTGVWNGQGPQQPKFQWYFGTASVVNGTNQSQSVQSAGSWLTCVMTQGHSKWGTTIVKAMTGTVAP